MANTKRVAIVGLGSFGKEAEKLLRGDVGELLIIAKDSQYLEQFSKPETYNPNVWALKGDIDETNVIDGLIELKILPANGNGSSAKKTLDVAIVDLAHISGEINDSVVERISPYAETTIAPTRNPAHVQTLEKLGSGESTLVSFCPEQDAAERIVLRIFYGLDARDVVRILPNLYSATLDVPDSLNGQSIYEIEEKFGVDILFFIQSIEEHRGRGKKVLGYTEMKFKPKDLDYCISKEDTSMRVLGTFSQIKKLGSKI